MNKYMYIYIWIGVAPWAAEAAPAGPVG